MILFHLIQLILIVSLGLAILYIFIFSVAGHFYREKPAGPVSRSRRIAVLIPGYKEDEVIVHVAENALNQDYPAECFDVVIIADTFQPQTLATLGSMPVRLIEVSFEKSTKSRALNRAMEIIGDDYDIALVLDADNIMEKDFLKKINAAFEKDYIAVQGHRAAKNVNNWLAVLDAVSEEINNHIFRKGHRALGLSSAIIGSGMAFRYGYFKELMSTVDAVGGFDKEIELKMLKAGHRIEYLDNAVVYDEKVQKAEVFSNQRRRWLSAQFHYFRKDIFNAVKQLFLKGNIDYFDKAVQFIQPPRILLLGTVKLLGMGFSITGMFLGDKSFPAVWALLTLICAGSLLLSVPGAYYNRKTLHALVGLPAGMLLMMRSLLKIKGANRNFIHTHHSAIQQVPVKSRI